MTRVLPSARIAEIIAEEAAAAGLKPAHILGRCRLMKFVVPRHRAMARARAEGFSLKQIATAFNRRDHTTVLNALARNAERTIQEATCPATS